MYIELSCWRMLVRLNRERNTKCLGEKLRTMSFPVPQYQHPRYTDNSTLCIKQF